MCSTAPACLSSWTTTHFCSSVVLATTRPATGETMATFWTRLFWKIILKPTRKIKHSNFFLNVFFQFFFLNFLTLNSVIIINQTVIINLCTYVCVYHVCVCVFVHSLCTQVSQSNIKKCIEKKNYHWQPLNRVTVM